VEIRIDDIANGGDGIGRIDGKAHFIPGVIPGEIAEIEVTEDRGNFARGRIVSLTTSSPHRVDAPCPYFARCGGCSWQFAAYDLQRDWKRAVIAGQLRHLGRVEDPQVRETAASGDPYGYRNRIDLHVAGGRPALVERSSHRLVGIERCLLVRPELDDLMQSLGPLHGVERLTLRYGTATGDGIVVIAGKVPDQAATWGTAVATATRNGVRAVIGDPIIREEVAGVRFRISGTAFFQVNTPGAEVLVGLAAEALQVTDSDTLLDGFSGGGLFAATVGASARSVTAVENAPDSVSDARYNLRDALPGRHRVVRGRFDRVVQDLGEPWTVAVVDPPRSGLGRTGVAAVTATEPRAIAYVSCDAASLARDTLLLSGAGYTLDWVAPVDMFPQTPHVEAVARFVSREP
jgi:tRNA/tmRNA/rRNA uracil-C5-methylase (TrmA/RlmC/RlmD family)